MTLSRRIVSRAKISPRMDRKKNQRRHWRPKRRSQRRRRQRRRHQGSSRLYRKRQAWHWDNAVLATADPQAQLVNLDATDEMASTACLESPETVVLPLHQPQNWCPNPQSNAHARPHQEMQEHQDPRDQMDHQVNLEHQALMENQEIKDHEDHPARPDPLVLQETKVPLAIPAESPARKQAQLDHPVLTANQVHPVLPADQERMVKTETPATLVPQEMLVNQVLLAKLAALEAPETPARLAHLAVANTALQLVWLQVIRRLRSSRLGRTLHRPRRGSAYSSPPTNKLGITAILNAPFSSNVPCQKTFLSSVFYILDRKSVV